MEFPRHCHKPEGLYVVVGNAEQYEAVTANGWSDLPEAHVEKPVEVRFVDAVKPASEEEAPSGVSSMSVKDAAPFIAAADADALAVIEAEETNGKNRAGVLKLIDARKAELAG